MKLLHNLLSPRKTNWFISVQCDYCNTHLGDVEKVINSAVMALQKIGGIKISRKNTSSAQNRKIKIADVFYYEISFPFDKDNEVREALKPFIDNGLKLTDKIPNES